MMNPNELFIVASIVFFAGGLLVYWVSRVIVLLNASKAEANALLDDDLRVGRQIWSHLRSLFAPPQTFLLP
jgi:hypothetical protein